MFRQYGVTDIGPWLLRDRMRINGPTGHAPQALYCMGHNKGE